jgi:predicted ester cyclase
MGIPPTGRVVTVSGIAIDRLADGKVAESWVNLDALNLLRQLGAPPTLERGPSGPPDDHDR